jgi:integrase
MGEATALTWQDIDLTTGRISVRDTETEAGVRLVDVLPALRDEFLSHRHANATAKARDLVFPTPPPVGATVGATRARRTSGSFARSSRRRTSSSRSAGTRRCPTA